MVIFHFLLKVDKNKGYVAICLPLWGRSHVYRWISCNSLNIHQSENYFERKLWGTVSTRTHFTQVLLFSKQLTRMDRNGQNSYVRSMFHNLFQIISLPFPTKHNSLYRHRIIWLQEFANYYICRPFLVKRNICCYRLLDAGFVKRPTCTGSQKFNNDCIQVPHNEATVLISLFVTFSFIKKNF
jgi:hypothetical protein